MTRRAVDGAMTAMRPEKVQVRTLWLQSLRQYADRMGPDETLYLTLAGAEGNDIQMLIDEGLLERTETGAIAEEDLARVVAVESSVDAARQLQEKYPGLKIVERNVRDLVRGPRPIRWPDATEKDYCRAAVVNLDLNEVLATDDGLTFPLMEIISKFIVLHQIVPAVPNWTLLLTVHGETTAWGIDAFSRIFQFLAENFTREPGFSDECKTFFGDALHAQVLTGARGNLPLSVVDQQKILMVFVPKKIAELVHGQGWDVITSRNLRYGGGRTAPMTTWIIDFVWQIQGRATPEALYKKALRAVLANQGFIDPAGRLT